MATAALRESEAREQSEHKRLWTYDELLAEAGETKQRMELWDGELIMSPAPTPNHQTIVLNFAEQLKAFVTAGKLGRVFIGVDVIFTQRRTVQPDVIFISTANLGIVQDRIRGVPDLCMEVISQTWQRDRINKKELYQQFGVKEYWIIDPEPRSVEILAYAEGVYQLRAKAADAEPARSKLLEGFAVSFNQLLV